MTEGSDLLWFAQSAAVQRFIQTCLIHHLNVENVVFNILEFIIEAFFYMQI